MASDAAAHAATPHPAHHAPAPIGGPLVTPVTVFLATLVAIAAGFLLLRFTQGLGAVTNLNDGYPFGIWIAYDVVVGSAFACGGYAMALLAYIFNKGEYHPLVRPALLASMFGYTLAGVSVIFDLGRWWNFWHIFWPGYAQVNSVMFEVALCISAYSLVMFIEFAPVFMDRPGLAKLKKKLSKVLFFFIALGVTLPTMHQSSLGSMLVVFGTQVHPLWQANWLMPLLYLMTAVLLGFSVVIFEATVSSVGFKRALETPLVGRLCDILWKLLAAYLAVRVGDLVFRGAIVHAFSLTWQAFWFWVEMACFVAPLVFLRSRAARRNASRLFVGAVLLMLGGMALRVNGFLIGYMTGEGWRYFPALGELMITIGLIAFEILGYIVIVRRFPVLAAEPAPAR